MLLYITDDIDYNSEPDPTSATLNTDTRRACFEMTTSEDILVEGTETFVVQFTLRNRFGSFVSVNRTNTAAVVISILDDDRKPCMELLMT